MSAEQAWESPRPSALTPDMTVVPGEISLPSVFSPGEAARLLRHAGLTEITECALRTRAYRKQVPFHLNGRRIVFTLSDLQEIAESGARRPQPQAVADSQVPEPARLRRRTSSPPRSQAATETWRARRPGDPPARPHQGGSEKGAARGRSPRQEKTP
jgi:hypothetical protein